MKADGKIAEQEISYMKNMIEKMDLAEKKTSELEQIVQSLHKSQVNFDIFKNDDEAMAVIINMIALAKVDGNFHKNELWYIKQAGKNLGFSDDDIVEMIND